MSCNNPTDSAVQRPGGPTYLIIWISEGDGSTGADVGVMGADVGSTGADVGSTGADVGSTGAEVGDTGAGVMTSTLAASESDTGTPVEAPTPLIAALNGPSGASDPSLVGPDRNVTLPGHKGPETGVDKPPLGAGSLNTTLDTHSPLVTGTVIW